jgi:hypothetical protein
VWKTVEPEGAKPTVPGLGPYREAAARPSGSIVRAWRGSTTGSLVFLTFFATVWNVGVGAVMVEARGITIDGNFYPSLSEALGAHPSNVFIFLFPLAGIVMGYIVLACWINRTVVTATMDALIVERGPLPWRNARVVVSASELVQLYVQAYTSHEENDAPITAYRVMANRRAGDGSPVLIDRGMKSYEDARALEQWIEERMGINDRPVPGEYRPGADSAPKYV